MFDKLKNFYTNCVFQLSMFGINLAKSLVRHTIIIQGLDPDKDVEKAKSEEYYELLSSAVDKEPTSKKIKHRFHSKVPKPLRISKNESRMGYVNKINAPPGSIPDYSNAGEHFDSEKIMRPFLSNVETTKKFPDIYTVEDQKTFDALDTAIKTEELSTANLLREAVKNIEASKAFSNNLMREARTPVSPKKKPKKVIKKPITKSTKKAVKKNKKK